MEADLQRKHIYLLSVVAAVSLTGLAAAFAQDAINAETIRTFDIAEADQGIGVDDRFFYVIDNTYIGKHDKVTGERVAFWEEVDGGPIVHLDSATIVDGLLYASHSNYPEWPMTSSVEIWNVETMEHVGTHSFGIDRGSLTWLDYHDGSWWGTFANYDIVNERAQIAYGGKFNTQVVRFDAEWRVVEAWVLPTDLLDRFENMSNSGGSWGPDGRLYLSGHDPAEAYAMELPDRGSILKWVGTVPLVIAGQGIAWDRSEPGILYGINRAGNQVIVSRVDLPSAM
jgi:hypothetical protein